jgi:hypothetical protein
VKQEFVTTRARRAGRYAAKRSWKRLTFDWRNELLGRTFGAGARNESLTPALATFGRAVSQILFTSSTRSTPTTFSHLSMRPVPAARVVRAKPRRLFGLAPDGVFRAAGIAADAVGFYPAFSPFPRLHGVVCFLWHCPSTRRYSRLPPLARSIAPCGVWTFLHPEEFRGSGYPLFQIFKNQFGKFPWRVSLTANRITAMNGAAGALPSKRRSLGLPI